VIEVDEHGPVGDHALLADADMAVGGDRALLPDHGLLADDHLALVAADLAAVAHPDEAAEPQLRPAGDLDLQVATEEHRSVGLHPPTCHGQIPPPQVTVVEPRVLQVEHPVPAGESKESEEPHGSKSRDTAPP
jgi:hypothetical protein